MAVGLHRDACVAVVLPIAKISTGTRPRPRLTACPWREDCAGFYLAPDRAGGERRCRCL